MIYIGATSTDLKTRIRSGYRHNSRLVEAVKHFGWDRVVKEIIADGLSEEDAYKIEIETINALHSCDPTVGYNIQRGGKLAFTGIKHSKDAISKMKKSAIGKHCGSLNGNYGVKQSEETKQKNRDSHAAFMHPVEQYSKDGNFIARYESVVDAARKVNTSAKNIRCCINGESHHAVGYVWKYAEASHEASW